MKLVKICLLLSILIATTGCWDQKLLSKSSLAFSLSFDETDDSNKLEAVSIIRALKPTGSGEIQPYNTNYHVTGPTPLSLREEMNKIIPGTFSTNKVSSILVGESLAKKDIYALLDVLYRDPKSNVNAKIILTKGKSTDILKDEYIKGALISKALKDLLTSAEDHSIIPSQSLATIMPVMFDPGQDFVLPFIEKIKGNLVKVRGVGLFDKVSYTGKNLIGEDASLYLLMVGKEGSHTQFSIIDPDKRKAIDQKLSFTIRHNKHKIKLKIKDSKPVYTVSLKLKVSVSEYSKGLLTNEEIHELEKKITTEMTKRSHKVTDLLIKSNCDALALGRKLIAKDPKLFEKYKRKDMLDLRKVEINPKVQIEIVSNGIMD